MFTNSDNYKQKVYDTHTLHVLTGVARKDQLIKVLGEAIEQAEEILGRSTNCQYKVNILLTKNGEYYGYGYIYVSSEEIYWMLLGKNPDGSERIEEYPDPNWVKPEVDKSNEINTGKSWFDFVEEEDAYIRPMIKNQLEPLIQIPGYEYDEDQYIHLQNLAKNNPQESSDVPKMGYFVISRGFARDAEYGKINNVLCCRAVPDWIPMNILKNIFSMYSDNDEYPIISHINGRKYKKTKIVFIKFDPSTKNAQFALLMTRKLRIKHPTKKHLRCTLILDHAYENR